MFALRFSENSHENLLWKSTRKWHGYPLSFHGKNVMKFDTDSNDITKPVFLLWNCHEICSQKSKKLASDHVPGLACLFTPQWSGLVIWSNMNKLTSCEGSHFKHHCSYIHCDENSTILEVFLVKIPWLLDILVIIQAVFVCVRITNSIVTSCSIELSAVLLTACHFCHAAHDLPLAFKSQQVWFYYFIYR